VWNPLFNYQYIVEFAEIGFFSCLLLSSAKVTTSVSCKIFNQKIIGSQ
jgi:hypothetical protein